MKAWTVLKMGLRAAVWKSTPDPCLVGLPVLVFWAFVAMSAGLLDQYVEAGNRARFSVYGLNAALAWTALSLAITGLFIRPEGRATALAATLVLSIGIYGLSSVIAIVQMGSTWASPGPALWTSNGTAILVFIIHLVWWIGAMLAILRSVEPERRERRLVRIAGLWLALFVASVSFPHQPAFRGRDFDRRLANWWEYIPALLNGSFNEEEPSKHPPVDTAVELRQPALLETAVSQLTPQRRGIADIYTIGIAGWADQDVFIKELDGALASIAKSFSTEGRVLRLVNHPESVRHTPIATRQNFAAAVRSVARAMDKEEDVLLLLMTSHGSSRGIALKLRELVYDNLTPDDVAQVLAEEGVKNRIVIVSACYSGVFIKPLADDNTIIVTAADERSSSFGCSNDREWTYFGDAFFNLSLRPGADIEEVFANAKSIIAQWEARGGLSPSRPQAHFGQALRNKLAPVNLSQRPAEPTNSDLRQ